MFNAWSGRLMAAVLGAFLCAPAALSQTKPAAAATDPFAKVPALPTACYSAGETFYPKLEAAQAAVAADRETQEAVNQTIKDDFQNIDMMEKATRMQQWMMSNPQEAAKFMQAQQAAGADLQPAILADGEVETKFANEQKEMIPRYQAALKQAFAPADAKYAALAKKLVDAQGCGFGDGECGIPDWAMVEYNAIQKEKDAAYVATCPQWWGASGQVTAYMKRYKDWLVQKHIPFHQSLEAPLLSQYAIMNTPSASYRSTEPYKGAHEYMNAAFVFYQRRDEKPRCTAAGCDLY